MSDLTALQEATLTRNDSAPGTEPPSIGSTTDGLGPSDPTASGIMAQLGGLAARFVVPPFTVLDTRQGYWLDRREQWKSLGIESELGREGDALGLKIATDRMAKYNGKEQGSSGYGSGTSIFDPVLCECVYRWLTVAGDHVLDPFAGGSVRGLVAATLGRQYTGIELRGEQVRANELQAHRLAAHLAHEPYWIEGDSLVMEDLLPEWDAPYQLVFTCPPYYDLEVYSDDPSDLSNAATYDEFKMAYACIIESAAKLLADNCFMVFVVSEIRNKKGVYRGFVHDTIEAAQLAGLTYYNHAILVNSVGSLPIRAAKHFAAGRKLGKCHQDVLMFVKGSPQLAAKRVGEPDTLANVLASPQLSIELDGNEDRRIYGDERTEYGGEAVGGQTMRELLGEEAEERA